MLAQCSRAKKDRQTPASCADHARGKNRNGGFRYGVAASAESAANEEGQSAITGTVTPERPVLIGV